VNIYGSTEVSADVLATKVSQCELLQNQAASGAPNSFSERAIGQVIDHTQAYILDESGNLLPPGATGHLYIGGKSLARGYINQSGSPDSPDSHFGIGGISASQTASRFVPNPFSNTPGERLYHTGDLARYLSAPSLKTDGIKSGDAKSTQPVTLLYMGRADHQIKIRGMRIETDEIAQCLRQHPAVADCVVHASQNDTAQRLVAYFVLTDQSLDKDLTKHTSTIANELTQLAKQHLPAYMVPAVMMPLSELPRTASGKVDFPNLPQPKLAYVSENASTSEPASNAKPTSNTEQQLATLWQTLLQPLMQPPLQQERIGRHDNFFDLGGHSLLATQLIGRIAQTFNVALNIRDIFTHQQLSALAAYIDKRIETVNTVSALPAITTLPPVTSDTAALSYAQQRLWFLYRFSGANAAYNMPMAVQLSGDIAADALGNAIRLVIARHDSLRTQMLAPSASKQAEAQQKISQQVPKIELETVASHHELAAICQQEMAYPFRLEQETLCRVRLLHCDWPLPNQEKDQEKDNASQYVLLFTAHHSVSDGWSNGIVLSEILQAYQYFSSKDSVVNNTANLEIHTAQLSEAAGLPAASISYRDYAQWQRYLSEQGHFAAQLSYWQQQLAELPPVLEFPSDRPRPAQQQFNGASCPVHFNKALTENLQQLSKREGSTLFMTLMAAYSLLLSRYSGQHDIAVGTPVANRTQPETEHLVGYLANTLVVRSQINVQQSFTALLQQTKETTLQAFSHQDVPFDQVVDACCPTRNPSYTPLFQVMLVLQNAPVPQSSSGTLNVAPLVLESHSDNSENSENAQAHRSSRFDFTFTLSETANGIEGAVEYSTDLFDNSTIVRLVQHYQHLLQQIVAEPAKAVGQLSLLTDAEQQQVLHQWQSPPLELTASMNGKSGPVTVPGLIKQHSLQHPHSIALIHEQTHISYGELEVITSKLAAQLQQRGVVPETPVGVSMERGVELVIAILAILKAGGCYVPMDPTYPVERLAYLQQNSQTPLILTDASSQAAVIAAQDFQEAQAQQSVNATQAAALVMVSELISIAKAQANNVLTAQSKSELNGDLNSELNRELHPNNLAYIIYTSGSTGKPKGVGVTHAGWANLALAQQQFGISQTSRKLQFASMSFDAMAFEMSMALTHGAALCLINAEQAKSGKLLQQHIAAQQLTHATLPPAILPFMSAAETDLTHMVLAGEALNFSLAQQWVQGSTKQQNRVLFNAYGPTETTVCATAGQVLPDAQFEANLNTNSTKKETGLSASIGQALSNQQCYALDQNQQLVPVGVAGELYVGGAQVTRGYLNRSGLTAERFVPNPFSQNPGERLYRTGDIVRWLPNGTLLYVNRIDDQVKLRGFRIEPGEIEQALSGITVQVESEPQALQVSNAAVLVHSPVQSSTKPASQQLLAFVELSQLSNSERTADIAQAISHSIAEKLQQKLPQHMWPNRIIFLPALPLTSNRKIDKKALLAMAQEQQKGEQKDKQEQNESAAAQPQTDTEQTLASLWQQLLGCERVLRHDNFFESGANSLLATQLINHLQEAFALPDNSIPVRLVFENQTLAQQAQALDALLISIAAKNSDERENSKANNLTIVPNNGPKWLSYAQQRLWFLGQYMGPNAVYNITLAQRLRATKGANVKGKNSGEHGEINLPALQRGLIEVLQRHEVLRSRFVTAQNAAIQQVEPAPERISVETVNASELQQIAFAERYYPFDVTQDLLCRIRLLQPAALSLKSTDQNSSDQESTNQETSEYVLLVTMHHAISDGWSLGVFFRELVSLYQHYCESENSLAESSSDKVLAPLDIQYSDYAAWQKQFLRDGALRTQLDYWRVQLQGLPPCLTLPTDRPRPAEQTFNGSILSVTLPAQLSHELKALSEQQGATLYMTLLSAFSVLLSRYSGQTDIAVGSPVANRTRKQTESLIGFFANTLVMRSKLAHNPSFSALLQANRDMSINAYANQDVPFERLVDELSPERNPAFSPLFQVMFSLQNMPLHSTQLANMSMTPLVFAQNEQGEEHSGVSRFDLTLSLQETDNGIVGEMEYNTDLFNRDTIARFMAHFEVLLGSIVAAPNTPVQQLNYLSEEELQQGWVPASFESVNDLTDELARESDSELAPVEQPISEPLTQLITDTAAELSTVITNSASPNSNAGANKDKVLPIAILCQNKQAKLVATLASWQSGACVIWLPADIPALTLSGLKEHHSFKAIITDTEQETLNISQLNSLLVRLNSTNETLFNNAWLPLPASLFDKNLKAAFMQPAANRGRKSFTRNHIPISFSAVKQLLGIKEKQATISVNKLLNWLEQDQLFNWQQQPGIILDAGNQPVADGVIGEWCIEVNDWAQASWLPASQLINEQELVKSIAESKPTHWYRTGCFAVRLKHKNKRNIHFIDAKTDSANYGNYQRHLSAADTAIRLSSLPELLQQPGIDEVCLQAFDSVPKQANSKLSYYQPPHWEMYVVPDVSTETSKQSGLSDQQKAPDKKQLRALIMSNQIHNQMHNLPLPHGWQTLTTLPRDEDGLIDSKQLPEPLSWQKHYVAPRNELERALAAIWQASLGRDEIGIDDNYFVLGGDSIRSIQLVADAKKHGVAFEVKDLFANPTIAELAGVISDRQSAEVKQAENISQQNPQTKSEYQAFSLISDSEKAAITQNLSPVHQQDVIEDAYPLSMMQQGMVLLAIKDKHLNVYQNMHIYHFASRWDKTGFEQALGAIVAQHPMLRSVYDLSQGRPLQLVLKQGTAPLEVIDVRHESETSLPARIRNWTHAEQTKGLKVQESLWRLTIYLLPDNSFLFCMLIHHAQWDGWSLESFAAALYQNYGKWLATHPQQNAVAAYTPPTQAFFPAPVTLPAYGEFIALEQAALHSEDHQKYWQTKLNGAHLPWWIGAPKTQSATVNCPVSLQSSVQLSHIASRLGVQEKSLWCAVYLAMLTLLDGNDGVTGGIINQGRPEIPGGQQMLGVFLNALPIAVPMQGRSWAQFICAVDAELREQHGFRRFPLAEIQNLSGLDLSAVLFTYANWHVYYADEQENSTGSNVEAGTENLIPNKVEAHQETNYLMDVYASKDDKTQQFSFSVVLDAGVFNQHFQRRIQTYVSNILRQIEHTALQNHSLTTQAVSINMARLLGNAETQHLTRFDNNAALSISDNHYALRIEQQFATVADQVNETQLAVSDGTQQLTYAQLQEQSSQLAHYLHTLGVTANQPVGICLTRSPTLLVAVMAVLKAGGFYVPLDPEYPEQRLEYMADDSGCRIVLTESDLMEELAFLSMRKSLPLDSGLMANLLSQYSAQSFAALAAQQQFARRAHPDDLAYVIYTSGTTGNPKGVQVTHRGLCHYLAHAKSDYFAPSLSKKEIKDQALAGAIVGTSINFDATVTSMLTPLLCGKQVRLIPQLGAEYKSGEISELKNHIFNSTEHWLFKLTPSHLDAVSQLLSPKDDIASSAHLQHCFVVGGEQFKRCVFTEWQTQLPNARFVNEYGPTETVVGCTVHSSGYNSSDCSAGYSSQSTSNAVAIGEPIANTQVYVTTADMELVPEGVAGELLIGGPGVARGYLGKPALTAEKFMPNPYSNRPGERLYRSGDRVKYLENGELSFLSRVDEQLKIRGFRVEPDEIANTLKQCQTVQDAVVMPHTSEQDLRLIAYVVWQPEAAEYVSSLKQDSIEQNSNEENTEQESAENISNDLALINHLRSYADQHLPQHMAIAQFMVLNALPLTVNGKIDKRALPEPDLSAMQAEYAAPNSDTEATLCQCWQNLLKLDRVGVKDNFWSLGGQSLLALRLTNMLRQDFELEIPLKVIFDLPTIAELAGFIDEEKQMQLNAVRLQQASEKAAQIDDDEEMEEGAF